MKNKKINIKKKSKKKKSEVTVCPVCWSELKGGIVKGMCLNDDCLTNHGQSDL